MNQKIKEAERAIEAKTHELSADVLYQSVSTHLLKAFGTSRERMLLWMLPLMPRMRKSSSVTLTTTKLGLSR